MSDLVSCGNINFKGPLRMRHAKNSNRNQPETADQSRSHIIATVIQRP